MSQEQLGRLLSCLRAVEASEGLAAVQSLWVGRRGGSRSGVKPAAAQKGAQLQGLEQRVRCCLEPASRGSTSLQLRLADTASGCCLVEG